MSRVAPALTVSDDERIVLLRWSKGRRTPARLVRRAKIVLRAADGWLTAASAGELGTQEKTVGLWRRRLAAQGPAGIEQDASGRGRPATVQRGVLEDIVGLSLNPPEHALVFSVDEKSQIQALDRTQPGLPIKTGRAGTMTQAYKRHGTTTLFAALCTRTGHVSSTGMPRPRHQAWIKCLARIDREAPPDLAVHLLGDNSAPHNHAKVQRWLHRHPRFHGHGTPTSASWLNMVKRFLRDLTDPRIRRGVFRNVQDVSGAIDEDIFHHNDDPKPFIWTKKASDILAKVMRARATLDNAPSV